MAFPVLVNEQFNGAIWRMEIDEINDTLFVETRDNDNKQVSFSSVNLNTGKVYFKQLTMPERWLAGIEAAHDGVMLVHNYQSETGPVHKGIIAVDAKSGKTLWSNYNFAFDYLSVQGPVVYDPRIQPRKLYLLDVKTGATTRMDTSSVYNEIQKSIIVPELTDTAFLPKNEHLQTFGNMAHYLEHNNLRIVSLHAPHENGLTQLLYIVDGDIVVYEDLLNTAIQKLQPEAFIVYKNCLIYIKNKSNLKALYL